MYLSFYGLNEKPFNLTPDASFLYPSQIHREVLGHLLFGINNRKGFICVTGEVGSGKTTLCRVLLNQLDENTEVAFVLNSYLTEFELLKTINEDLGISTAGRTRKELIDELNRYLLERRAQGKNIIVVIDEAQNLSIPVLEQLRMLSNLETEKEKLLQIILIGQPELETLLLNDKIRQLNQRITVRHHIIPLSKEELKEYIYYRLNVAGGRGDIIFNDGAINELFRYSKGIPRAINVIADNSLLVGYVANSKRITRSMVRQAVKEVWGKRKEDIANQTRYKAKSLLLRASVGISVVTVLMLISFFFLNHIKGNPDGRIPVETSIQNEHFTNDSRPIKPEVKTTGNTEDKTTVNPDVKESDTPENDTASNIKEEEDTSSSMLMTAMDTGGRMIGKSLSSLSKPISLSGSDDEVEKPVVPDEADTGEIDSWATSIDATVDILRLWKVEQRHVGIIQKQYKGKEVSPAGVARIAGLGYAILRTDLKTLKTLNLPALAEINERGKSGRYAVISGFANDSVTLLISSREVQIGLDELGPLLTGNVDIYCSDSFVNPKHLHSGMEMSLEVRKLQDYLKQLGYFEGNCNGWFTPETESAVLEFQAGNNLKPTGQVTGYMKLLIYSRLRHVEDGIPRLTK